jgi:polyribonucleotide nucleotidyltransferase
MKIKTFETEFGGKKLKVEISDLADQANGSVLVRYGETAVFATAVMSKYAREGLDHFPLTVDYEERFYAAGQILGSRFMRREGRPSEVAVLTGRLIDRSIRPLFNMKMKNEVQVVALALSVDSKNDSDIPAIIGASLALGISDIPWQGPIGAVRMGYIDANLVVNPTYEERDKSLIDIIICGKDKKINMIESEAKEAPEEIIVKALEKAVEEIEKIEDFQKKIIKEIGKEKAKIETKEEPEGMNNLFEKNVSESLKKTLYETGDKKTDSGEIKDYWIKIAKE